MKEETQGRLCTIYKGSKEKELYIFVPRESGAENIPEELLERTGDLTEVMTINITPVKKLARADAAVVLKSIDENGYYLQLPPEISIQVLNDGD